MDEQCQKKVLLLLTILMSSFTSWLQYIVVACTQHRIRQWRLAINACGRNFTVLGLQNMMENIQQQCYKHRKPRSFWKRPGRNSAWWKNFLNEKVVAEEWYENFRLSKQSFDRLCVELRSFLQKQISHLREPLSVETQVAIALYYLSDEGRYRKVANAFGVARGTVSVVVRRVCFVIAEVMGPKYIKLPSTEDHIVKLASNFERKHGFPQC